MGILGTLFGNKDDENELKKAQEIYFAQLDEKMKEACIKAQETFKYFWRELYWEYRRIVPAHDLAIVKVPFEQGVEGSDEPFVEHMWINEIDFDGEYICFDPYKTRVIF